MKIELTYKQSNVLSALVDGYVERLVFSENIDNETFRLLNEAGDILRIAISEASQKDILQAFAHDCPTDEDIEKYVGQQLSTKQLDSLKKSLSKYRK